MKVAAIIQARMGSSRFPGKVLEKISGHSMIWHIVQRVKSAITVDEIILATSDKLEDEVLIWEARKMDIAVFRGSEDDVLERYYLASKIVKSNKICRVTGDNPLIEPRFIDMAVARMSYSDEDYLSIDGCPLGTGIEVFTKKALSYSAKKASKPYQREHVTPFIRENSKIFRIGQLDVPLNLFFPDLRLTVDTNEDFALIEKIYNRLYKEGTIIALDDVIELMLSEPEWSKINSHIRQKSVV